MEYHLKKDIGNSSFILKLFCSFLLLGSIPVIAITILNHRLIINFYTTTLGESYTKKLQAADTIAKMWDDEMKNEALAISMNEYLNGFELNMATSGYTSLYDQVADLMKISSELRKICIINNRYSSISIISAKRELIITSNHGTISLKDKNTSIYRQYGVFLQADYPNLNKFTLSMRDMFQFTRNENVLTYAVPLMADRFQSDWIILFDLKETELCRIINGGIEENGGNIFIISSDGMILSHTDKENIGKNWSSLPIINNILQSESSQENFLTTAREKDFFVYYFKSDLIDWYYCSFVPIDEFNMKTKEGLLLIIVLSVSLLILVIPLSYILASKLNTPLKKIVYQLK
ncbi:MAG: cache domain-containing protein, partial [Prevotella sp.]|nr:cache domain-containing protein [Prevotella sp.]